MELNASLHSVNYYHDGQVTFGPLSDDTSNSGLTTKHTVRFIMESYLARSLLGFIVSIGNFH